MNDFFERRSPYLALISFGGPMVVTCFLRDWKWALISLVVASFVYVCLIGLSKLLYTLKGIAGLVALFIIINPLVSTTGTTVLLFVNGRPITLEAIIHGISLGVMLMAVILWSGCWNHVMTEEKLSYIFKGLSPQMVVVLSMSLRLIPLYKRRWDSMVESQKNLGIPQKTGLYSGIKMAVQCFSGLMDWGIENGKVTSKSMVARGACLNNRKRAYGINKH